MTERHLEQAIDEFSPTSRPGLSGETVEKRFSLMRVAKSVAALTIAAGALIVSDVEGHILQADPDLLGVSASMLPKTLPKPVEAMEQNTLEADLAIDKSITQVSGSGIQLNTNTLITAGHVFRSSNGSLFPNALWCNAFTAISPRGFFRGISQVSVYNENSPLDIALLRTKAIGKIDGPLHSVEIADKSYIGEALYFINYQITPKGYLRPSSPSAKPAIYGGIVESYDKKGNINVPTVVSYGSDDDHDARLGSSGGPVFNSKGELVGISIQINEAGPTLKDYSWLLRHVGLEKFDGNVQYTDAIVEPVSPKIINDLEAKESPFHSCKD